MTDNLSSEDNMMEIVKGQHWQDCKLGRRDQAEKIKVFIENKYKQVLSQNTVNPLLESPPSVNYTINIGASWGAGKTHFIQRLKADFDEDNYATIYFDAWRFDQTKNALGSLLVEFNHQLSYTIGQKINPESTDEEGDTFLSQFAQFSGVISKLSGIVTQTSILVGTSDPITSSAAGTSVSAFVDFLAAKSNTDSKANDTPNFETLKNISKELIEEAFWERIFKRPIVFFIDELDRCRPDFAIEIIESVKHIFDFDHVIFIFSSDLKQLSSSIEHIYGTGYDGEHYLRKVFQRNITLLEPNTMELHRGIVVRSELDLNNRNYFSPCRTSDESELHSIVVWFHLFCTTYNCQPRDCEQAFDLIDYLLTTNNDLIHIPLVFHYSFQWIFDRSHFPTASLSSSFSANGRSLKVNSYFNFSPRSRTDDVSLDKVINTYSLFWNKPYRSYATQRPARVSFSQDIFDLIETKIAQHYNSNMPEIPIAAESLLLQIRTSLDVDRTPWLRVP